MANSDKEQKIRLEALKAIKLFTETGDDSAIRALSSNPVANNLFSEYRNYIQARQKNTGLEDAQSIASNPTAPPSATPVQPKTPEVITPPNSDALDEGEDFYNEEGEEGPVSLQNQQSTSSYLDEGEEPYKDPDEPFNQEPEQGEHDADLDIVETPNGPVKVPDPPNIWKGEFPKGNKASTQLARKSWRAIVYRVSNHYKRKLTPKDKEDIEAEAGKILRLLYSNEFYSLTGLVPYKNLDIPTQLKVIEKYIQKLRDRNDPMDNDRIASLQNAYNKKKTSWENAQEKQEDIALTHRIEDEQLNLDLATTYGKQNIDSVLQGYLAENGLNLREIPSEVKRAKLYKDIASRFVQKKITSSKILINSILKNPDDFLEEFGDVLALAAKTLKPVQEWGASIRSTDSPKDIKAGLRRVFTLVTKIADNMSSNDTTLLKFNTALLNETLKKFPIARELVAKTLLYIQDFQHLGLQNPKEGRQTETQNQTLRRVLFNNIRQTDLTQPIEPKAPEAVVSDEITPSQQKFYDILGVPYTDRESILSSIPPGIEKEFDSIERGYLRGLLDAYFTVNSLGSFSGKAIGIPEEQSRDFRVPYMESLKPPPKRKSSRIKKRSAIYEDEEEGVTEEPYVDEDEEEPTEEELNQIEKEEPKQKPMTPQEQEEIFEKLRGLSDADKRAVVGEFLQTVAEEEKLPPVDNPSDKVVTLLPIKFPNIPEADTSDYNSPGAISAPSAKDLRGATRGAGGYFQNMSAVERYIYQRACYALYLDYLMTLRQMGVQKVIWPDLPAAKRQKGSYEMPSIKSEEEKQEEEQVNQPILLDNVIYNIRARVAFYTKQIERAKARKINRDQDLAQRAQMWLGERFRSVVEHTNPRSELANRFFVTYAERKYHKPYETLTDREVKDARRDFVSDYNIRAYTDEEGLQRVRQDESKRLDRQMLIDRLSDFDPKAVRKTINRIKTEQADESGISAPASDMVGLTEEARNKIKEGIRIKRLQAAREKLLSMEQADLEKLYPSEPADNPDEEPYRDE